MRSRDFRIFWIGQFISLIGTWMQNTVQPYVAYHLTGQPMYLGLIGFAGTLPTVFLTLPAGVLIERLDKRRVVVVMQVIMAAQALALAGLLQIWHMLVLALVLGVANAVEITARQSMMPDLVELAELPNALALNAAGFNLARVAGPILAAPFLLLVQDGGEGWAFLANALSYLIVIGSLFLLRPKPHRDVPLASKNHVQAFREGQEFIRRSQLVSLLVVLSGVVGIGSGTLTKSGAGSATLSAANTLSGAVTVEDVGDVEHAVGQAAEAIGSHLAQTTTDGWTPGHTSSSMNSATSSGASGIGWPSW